MYLPCNSNRKNLSFCLNILNLACGTRTNSSLILNLLIGWAVEYCGDVMFYYFLLADIFGCCIRASSRLKCTHVSS